MMMNEDNSEEPGVDLEAMREQYTGSTLPELVRMHMKTLRKEVLPQAIRGTFVEFDNDIRPQLETWSNAYLDNWKHPVIVDQDLGELYDQTIADIRTMLVDENIVLSDKRVFDLFHIMAMKLALIAHTDDTVRANLGLD